MYVATTSEATTSERERLILEHLPQVRLIARRIHDRLPASVSLEDLVSTGVLGLIAAIDNFDPGQNVKLRTYAEYKIRGAILDSLRGLDWAPRDKRRKAKQIEVAIAELEQRLQRSPTEEEIAAELELDLEQYRAWLAEVQGLTLASLEHGPGHETGRSLVERISDDEENLPSRRFEHAELESLLKEALRRMPPVERDVLGLYYQEEMTLREIAQIMDVHLSRISQLKSQAILRLRSYLEKRWPIRRGR
jgi:RNA polymerase sigma factor for flagellar operon FliA